MIRSILACFKRFLGVFVLLALFSCAFFIANKILAAHTAEVTVDKTLVRGGSLETYSFTITNENGEDGAAIVDMKISTEDFVITVDESLVSCPVGWNKIIASDFVECQVMAIGSPIETGENGIIFFQATAPVIDDNYPWTVETRDGEGSKFLPNPLPETTVDATAPKIISITTKDVDGDGGVETATIVFSEAVNDASFEPNNFWIGGPTGIGDQIVTGIIDDNEFDVVVDGGVVGTEAKDVIYDQGDGADLVGNLLDNVGSDSIVEADEAFPIVEIYTLNDLESDVFFNPNNSSTVEIAINVTEPVKFNRVYICATDDDVCNSGTAVKWFAQTGEYNSDFSRIWNGKNAADEIVPDEKYKLKVKIKDAAENEQSLTLTPYMIAVDTAPPVVTLIGDEVMDLQVGEEFTDPGATAFDDIEGVLPVTVNGDVDTETLGTYIVAYSAVDSAGNFSAVERTVNVNALSVPAPVQEIIVGPGAFGTEGVFSSPQSPAVPSAPPQVLGEETFYFARNLEFGMELVDVTELQKRFTSEGVYSGPITGYFGFLTLDGARSYQGKYGISQTGFVGSLTRARLNGEEITGASASLNIKPLKTKIAGLQAQLIKLLEELALILQSQVGGGAM